MKYFVPLAVAALVCAAPRAYAQSPAAQTVLSEGRAAIGSAETGGIPAAKQAAVADALRSAVEKVCGVYVRAASVTRNYQLIKDEILTRADGFVVLKEIVRTERAGNIVRVVVRAEVSTRPLAERLKALRLTRAFRVFVDVPETVSADGVETALTDAGFPVSQNKADAEIIVRVLPRYVTVARTPLQTAAGAMTLFSVRAGVRITAIRAATGESVASLSASDTQAHIAKETARGNAATGAITMLLPRQTDALLILPAQVSEPVQIVASGIKNAADYAALAEAITLYAPGVQHTMRRTFAGTRAVYEADVLTDAAPLLARALETAPGLKRFDLQVTREARGRIVVAARRTEP